MHHPALTIVKVGCEGGELKVSDIHISCQKSVVIGLIFYFIWVLLPQHS